MRRFVLPQLGKAARPLFWLAIIFSVAASTAFVSLRFWVLPDIEKYHAEITTLASRAFGLPVQIGKIEGDWDGLRPHLVFTDVRLLDEKGNSALILRRIDNKVAWTTLFALELRLNTLEIDDPDLLIRRDKNGIFYVAGLKISGQSEDDKLSDWLLHQSHIIVRNGRVTWQDELLNKPLLILNQVQFKLDNSGRHHRFAVKISPPPMLLNPLEISADLIGRSFADWKSWRGELQAKIDHADVAAWSDWVALPEVLSQAKGGVNATIGIEAGQLSRVSADLDLREVQGRLAPNLPSFALATLSGRAIWEKLERGFEVSTQNLSLQMPDGFQLPATDFLLRLQGPEQNPVAEGGMNVNFFDLEKLPQIAKYLPLDEKLRQKLDEYSPSGKVSTLHAQWHKAPDQQTQFEVKAGFENLSVRRVGVFPGIAGLTGEVSGSDNSGELIVASSNLRVDAPEILLSPIVLDKFKMQAGWQRKKEDWDFKFNHLSLINEDLQGTAYGHYQTNSHNLGVADITLNLSRASVSKVVKYLPKKLLGDPTMNWLKTGLVAGNAEDVLLHLRGDLKDFPFPENKTGLFLVKAKTNGLVVDYAPEWPRVENATATLLIEGSRLKVDATAATLAGAHAQKISVVVPDFTSEDAKLQISGEAREETKLGLNFIQQSPVRGYIGGFTDGAMSQGQGKLSLNIDFPLSNKPSVINGRYEFFDNEISLGKLIPAAHKVTGELQFTESSLQTNNINAQMLGGPTNLAIQTEANGTLKIKLKGKANIDAWRKSNSHPLLQFLHGGTNWMADSTVQKNHFSVAISSNMQGLSSDLPAPLFKKGGEIIPLKFELSSETSTQDLMQLQYGDVLNLRLGRADDIKGQRQIKNGFIHLGTIRQIPDRDGLWLSGNLPLLSVENWIDVLKRMPSSQGSMPELEGADLTVQKLIGYDSTINALHLRARSRNGVTTAQIDSKEMNGEINWFPQGKGKLVVRFKNLALGDKEVKKDEGRTKNETHKVVNKSAPGFVMPAIDVAVEQFSYRGNLLGRLEFHASQFEKDVLLNSFRLTNPDGTLQMSGKWSAVPAQTHLAAKLSLNDVGKILNRSGYPNTVKNGSGTLDCDMTWGGSPAQFTTANLDGYLNLNMANGEFSKLDTIGGKGFEFKNISGIAKIKQGVVTTDNLKINGALANIGLAGQVDLSRETQNLSANVSPNIGNGVSLLAFAGGPAVGAVVFIANKILRDPLDKLASFEYNVTGTWAEPKIDKVGQAQKPPK